MKVTVKVKDVELNIDDLDISAVVKYDKTNDQLMRLIEKMCLEAKKLII